MLNFCVHVQVFGPSFELLGIVVTQLEIHEGWVWAWALYAFS